MKFIVSPRFYPSKIPNVFPHLRLWGIQVAQVDGPGVLEIHGLIIFHNLSKKKKAPCLIGL